MVLMLFHKKLYLDDEISENKRKIIRKLKHNKLTLGVYVIVLSESDTDQLEIYPSYVLVQDIFKDNEMTVVGIASDLASSRELLVRMTEDCLKETGKASFKEYFNM